MFKALSLLALAGTALAQVPTLAEALNSTESLSQLGTLLALNPALVETLAGASNITILAPSNDAFSAVDPATLETLTSDVGLLTALLSYHVLNATVPASAVTNTSTIVPTLLTNETYSNVTGGQVINAFTVDGNVTFFSGLLANSSVTTADVNFTGGVIHIIDTVLTVPANVSDTTLAAGLTSLRGALNTTGLLDTVSGLSDVTIFAPANAGFQAIGSALPNLTAEQASAILTYHVVEGTVGYSSALENNTVLPSVNGANLTVQVLDGGIFVNGARVIIADVLVANGVVHVIDNVLNPNNATLATAGATAGVVAFSGASSVSEVPFTSGQPTPTTNALPPATSAAETSEVSTGAAAPMQTGAVGMGALLGAAAVYFL